MLSSFACIGTDTYIEEASGEGFGAGQYLICWTKKTFDMVPHFDFKITIKAVGIFLVMKLRVQQP